MKKLALGALVAGLMAACGGGSDKKDVVIPDNGGPDVVNICSPLTQTGCSSGEKCTWIWDQLPPSGQTTPAPIGHIGCTAAGTVALGGNCGARALGGDSCAAGLACSGSECKTICDPNGATAAAACDADHQCAQYQNFFVNGGTTVAGVCDPACDPLSQDVKVGANKTACGSPMPTAPTLGCYGYEDFSCSGVAPTVANATALTLRDHQPPAGAYLNACAPGYIVRLISETGSMDGTCNGYCAALPTNNTVPQNALGSTAVLGKFPTDAAPVMGGATCKLDAQKGRGGQASDKSRCVFMWPYNVDDAGNLKDTPYVDTLGICMDIAHYQYDSNGDSTPDMPYPDCATLPPPSATTTGDFDDSGDWGCVKAVPAFTNDGKKVVHMPAGLRDQRFPHIKERAELLAPHTLN